MSGSEDYNMMLEDLDDASLLYLDYLYYEKLKNLVNRWGLIRKEMKKRKVNR